MLTVTLLAACAHRPIAAAAALDGGWSGDEVTVFVFLDEDAASPAVWTARGEGEELWPAGAAERRGSDAVQFRSTQGDPATASLTLTGANTALMSLVYDSDGRAEYQQLTRTAPRSRGGLQQAWADQRAAEMSWNVEAIRTAELAHFFALGAFLPAEIWPRAITALTPEPVVWADGSDFDALGWAPDGVVRGSFLVTVAEDGRDLTIHGWQDLDGDGVPAHWSATRTVGAARLSSDGVR